MSYFPVGEVFRAADRICSGLKSCSKFSKNVSQVDNFDVGKPGLLNPVLVNLVLNLVRVTTAAYGIFENQP